MSDKGHWDRTCPPVQLGACGQRDSVPSGFGEPHSLGGGLASEGSASSGCVGRGYSEQVLGLLIHQWARVPLSSTGGLADSRPEVLRQCPRAPWTAPRCPGSSGGQPPPSVRAHGSWLCRASRVLRAGRADPTATDTGRVRTPDGGSFPRLTQHLSLLPGATRASRPPHFSGD